MAEHPARHSNHALQPAPKRERGLVHALQPRATPPNETALQHDTDMEKARMTRHDFERHYPQIERLYFSGVPVLDIATLFGVSRSTLNAYLWRSGLYAKRQKHYAALVNQAVGEMKANGLRGQRA